MSIAKDDDKFGFNSEKRSFCFENNEVDQLFGISKNETEKLWAGISNRSLSENSLRSTDDLQTTKPLFSIISEKTLSCILAADKLQNVNTETAIE